MDKEQQRWYATHDSARGTSDSTVAYTRLRLARTNICLHTAARLQRTLFSNDFP